MRTIVVDFDTESGRDFEDISPIGVLLERGERAGFDSRYLERVTEDQDEGHDNYVRTMVAVEDFRDRWDKQEEREGMATVIELFTYLADNSYLGLRFRSLGKVEDDVTLEDAFVKYVVRKEPLVAMDDEEFPVDV